MSRTGQVIRNKNKREKADRQRKRQRLGAMQLESAYRSKLYYEMQLVKLVLSDYEVSGVKIEIPDKYLTEFMKAMYAEEMAEYSIEQIDSNKFIIGRQIVDF